jgi:hypothetical protein
MATLAERLTTPLPRTMRTLARDPRGYPIPFIVLVDAGGNAQFTINDVRKVHMCITRRLCSICGKRLARHVWFAGGSRCFLHEAGAFIDGPVHYECGAYALTVCPFLAASRYGRRIDTAKLKPSNIPSDMTLVEVEFAEPRLPELFGFGETGAYEFMRSEARTGVFHVHDWSYVEWWKAGAQVPPPDTGISPPIINTTT